MEDISKNIHDMTNKELKDSIIKFNLDKLKSINNSSYLNAFGAILSLRKALEDKQGEKYINKLSEADIFRRDINTGINLINDIKNKKNYYDNLNKAISIRKELYDFLNIVKGYYVELSYMGEMIDFHMIDFSKNNAHNKAQNLNIDKIVELIERTLEEWKVDYNTYTYIISQITYFLPMKLTKSKYFNIIENSLKRNLKDLNKLQLEDKIEFYKREWDSSLQFGYGVSFDVFFTKIQEFKKINLKEKTSQELKEIVKSIIDITKEINELYNFILILGLTYNMIITIYTADSSSLDKEILDIKDQWNKLLISNSKSELEAFLRLNQATIQESEKQTLSSIEVFHELNIEAASRENFIDNEIEDIFLYTRKVLTYYNDYNLSNIDLLLSENVEKVSKDYIDQSIDNLIGYFKRSLDKMNEDEKKVRIKKILSLIELPFANINEFKEYIRYSLSKVSSNEELDYIVSNILNFLNDIKNNTRHKG